VRQSATQYLAVEPRRQGICSWVLNNGTGSPDQQRGVFPAVGSVDISIAVLVAAAFGGKVNITVESRARSGLR
jgi:hypothetical protein